MKYNELYNSFVSLFPEDIGVFKELETNADVNNEEDGIHIMYGLVVVPYIRRIITEYPDKAKKAFDFFEAMKKDEDAEVGNVVDVSVLEDLITEDGGFGKYLPYVGEQTLKAARYISQFYNAVPF
jgi:hypothetical protein